MKWPIEAFGILEEVDAINEAKTIILNRLPIHGKRHSTKLGAKRMPKDAIAKLTHAFNYLTRRGIELLSIVEIG